MMHVVRGAGLTFFGVKIPAKNSIGLDQAQSRPELRWAKSLDRDRYRRIASESYRHDSNPGVHWRSHLPPKHRRWSLETLLRLLRCDSNRVIGAHSCKIHSTWNCGDWRLAILPIQRPEICTQALPRNAIKGMQGRNAVKGLQAACSHTPPKSDQRREMAYKSREVLKRLFPAPRLQRKGASALKDLKV